MKAFFTVLLLGFSALVFPSAFQGFLFPMGDQFYLLNDKERTIYLISEPAIQQAGRLIDLYERYAYFPGFPLLVAFRGSSETCPTKGDLISAIVSSTISVEETRPDQGILGLDLVAYSQEEGWWLIGSNGHSLLFCDYERQLTCLSWYTYPTLTSRGEGLVCDIYHKPIVGQPHFVEAHFSEEELGVFVARVEIYDQVYQGTAHIMENRAETLVSKLVQENSSLVRIDVFDSPTFRGEGYLRIQTDKTFLLPFEHTFENVWVEDFTGDGHMEILFAFQSGMSSASNMEIFEKKEQGYVSYPVPLLSTYSRGESVSVRNGQIVHIMPQYRLSNFALIYDITATYRYLGAGEWDISKPEEVPKDLLLQVAHKTFLEQAVAILAILPDLEARDAMGRTALMIASERNSSAEVIQALIAAGADIHATTPSGGTALMHAAASNPNPQIVRALINAGACLEARYETGMTALMFAASNNPNLQTLTTLIQHGASLHAMGANGETALHHAARSSVNPRIIHALVEAGANIHALDHLGYAPAIYAAGFNNNPDILAALIACDVDLQQGYADGWTLMDIAIHFKNESVISLLRSLGAQ